MAYIAQYSPRPGAASSRWTDDVDHEVKKDRFHRLTKTLQKYSLERNKEMVGRSFRVLVTHKDRKEGYLSGLTEGKVVLRFASDDESLIGNFVDVNIKSATPFSLEGTLARVISLA